MNLIRLNSTDYAGSPSLVLREGAGGWVNKSALQFGILFSYQFRNKNDLFERETFLLTHPRTPSLNNREGESRSKNIVLKSQEKLVRND